MPSYIFTATTTPGSTALFEGGQTTVSLGSEGEMLDLATFVAGLDSVDPESVSVARIETTVTPIYPPPE
jgi:hypothetical protein